MNCLFTSQQSVNMLEGVSVHKTFSYKSWCQYHAWSHTFSLHSEVEVKLPCLQLEGVWLQLHSFLNFALDEGEWLTAGPDCFTPRIKPWYSLNSRLGVPQDWAGHFEENRNLLPLPGIKPQTFDPVVQLLCHSHYSSYLLLHAISKLYFS